MKDECKDFLMKIDSIGCGELTLELHVELKTHGDGCDSCGKALAALDLATILFRTRSVEAESLMPPAFFDSQVMTSIRNSVDKANTFGAFKSWWEASSSIMAFGAAIAFLFSVIAITGVLNKEETVNTSSSNLYPAESVLMGNGRDLTSEQVFEVVYNPMFEEKK